MMAVKNKQNKYTRSARGQECQIRIPGYCNFNPETTVLCHLNGAGIGRKALAISGAYGCSTCHDIVDHRKPVKEFDHDEIALMHHEGVQRTQELMVSEGVIIL